ncbi:hypothetical protein [Hydrogenophaga sp.]|uniref:hypothetical protein n=1 Tax=Hydrogenophaga sp. TaxID=1904254 RepID=UPI0027218FE8|nr:hypothetical protein [Hydrogenophaga sp.]MDO9438225.1 hypothetical protein [Hydrogenophaga sp.]
MDPVPGHHHADLGELFSAHVHHASPAMRTAMVAILLLDRINKTPADTDEGTCRVAGQLLLNLGQVRLLCHWAKAHPMVFSFEVGARESAVDVLARVGDDWPRDVRLHVTLSTALPLTAIQRLQPFLWRHDVPDVELVYEGLPDQDCAIALAQTLSRRPLGELTLSGGAFARDFIVLLTGVAADRIFLALGPPDGASKSDVEQALAQLVGSSQATVLIAAAPWIEGRLTAHLLASRPTWKSVCVNYSPELVGFLMRGRTKVHRLELTAGNRILQTAGSVVRMLHAGQVQHLVLGDSLALVEWAEALSLYADVHKPKKILLSLEAPFVAPEGRDAEAAFASLPRQQLVGRYVPRTARNLLPGWAVLDEAALQRLFALSTDTRLTRVPPSQQASVDDEERSAIQILGNLLAANRTVSELVNYAKEPSSWLVPIKDLTRAVANANIDRDSTSLEDKVLCLQWMDLRAGLVKSVLEKTLADDPQCAQLMCEALIWRGHTSRPLTDKYWQDVGRKHTTRWISSDMNQVILMEVSPPLLLDTSNAPAPTPRFDLLPAADPSLLVIPAGAHTLQRLLDRLAAQTLDPANAQSPLVLAACRVIGRVLKGLSLPSNVMTGTVCGAVAAQLLQLGQWKLLQHLLPISPIWPLQLVTPMSFTTLKQMAKWPDPASECHLPVHAHFPLETIRTVLQFGSSVAPDKLLLKVGVGEQVDPDSLNAIKEYVTSRPGMSLFLALDKQVHVLESVGEQLIAFVNGLGSISLRGLSLQDFEALPEKMEQALVAAVKGWRIAKLQMLNCGDNLARQLLADRHWDAINLPASDSMANWFKAGMVSATKLVCPVEGVDALANFEVMVASCKGLEAIDVQGGSINGLAMANLLDKNRRITAAKCLPTMSHPDEGPAMLSVLRRNTDILSFEVSREGARPPWAPRLLDARTMRQIGKRTTSNRLLHARLVALGAGRGFGMGMGKGGLDTTYRDVGQHIGSFLDLPSALSLSATHKAAFAGSRHALETEIDSLADLLKPAVETAIGAASDAPKPASASDGTTYLQFSAAMKAMAASGMLAGPLQSTDRSKTGHMVLERVLQLRKAGVPDDILGRAIGRRLDALLHAAPGKERTLSEQACGELRSLVESLAYIGVIPARQWLRETYGIDVAEPPKVGQVNN